MYVGNKLFCLKPACLSADITDMIPLMAYFHMFLLIVALLL